MIVDCAAYKDGVREGGTLSLEQAGEAAQGDGSFVWLGVVEPTEEEFEAIAERFGLHELAVEDAINAHQRPKVESTATPSSSSSRPPATSTPRR